MTGIFVNTENLGRGCSENSVMESETWSAREGWSVYLSLLCHMKNTILNFCCTLTKFPPANLLQAHRVWYMLKSYKYTGCKHSAGAAVSVCAPSEG
jgi:hypothetical protein